MQKVQFDKTNLNNITFEKLEETRIFFQLTKKDFCSEIGISQDQYNKYKNQDRFISVEVLYKVSQAFSISIDFLIGNLKNMDEAFALFQYYSAAKSTQVKNEHIDFLKKYTLLSQIQPILKGALSEKSIWEKLLFNPKEDALRALGFVLSKISQQDINSDNAKQSLLNLIKDYYTKLSVLEKISTVVLTNEQKYLNQFVNSLNDAECYLFLVNAPVVIEEIKKQVIAPYSKIMLNFQKKGYKVRK